jgi:hypothetical protein
VPVALDRRVAYHGEHLSDNIARTQDGYLICRNAVIARTGFQTYRVSEIADPQGLLSERYNPDEEIQIWRDPSEVFSRATIASFEGKTFTLTHPDELLTPQNDNRHSRGHVQNVRQGDEPLSDGNLPLLADIIVKDEEAIRAVETGQRELSCGYTYRLAREGYRWDQRDILGNHVALVQKARAGEEARINDSAPEPIPAPVKKETRVKNIFKHLLGEGFRVFAKDAPSEDIAEALRDPNVLAAAEAVDGEKKRDNVISIATDGKEADKAPKMEYVGTTKDGVKIFKEVGGTETRSAGVDDKEKQAANDARKAMHDKLDKLLDASTEAALDAEMEEFKKKVNDFVEGEAHDDKHPEGCRCDDCMDKGKDKETEHEQAEEDAADEEEKEEKEEKEGEDAEIVRSEPVLAANERPKGALKAADVQSLVADSNLQLLKFLKPFVARSNDKKLKAAFDTLTSSLKKIVKKTDTGNGSYADFLKSATTRHEGTDADKEFKPRLSEAEKRAADADKIYADAMKKTGRPSAKFLRNGAGTN